MKLKHKLTKMTASISIMSGIAIGLVYLNLQANSSLANIKTDSQVSGSVAAIYKNADDMLKDADLVVTGSFTGNKIAIPASKPLNLPPRASENSVAPPRDPNLIYQVSLGHLDSEFRVAEIIKGQSASQIHIAQSGMITTLSESKPMSGDRFFKGGDSYVLFLNKALPHEIKNAGGRDFYYLVGAYQGGYRIKNGKAYSRDIEDLDSARAIPTELAPGYGHRVNGTDVSQLLQDLRIKAKK
jgi:hypothetical protein